MALLGGGAQVHIKPTCTSGQHQGEEREAQSVLAERAATPLCTVQTYTQFWVQDTGPPFLSCPGPVSLLWDGDTASRSPL